MVIIIYTDGACLNNGKPNAISGVGVHFSKNIKLDVFKKVQSSPHTNIRAEILAVIKALKICYELEYFNKHIEIYTDSKFVVDTVNIYIKKWRKNGWITVQNDPIKNLKDILLLDKYIKKFSNLSIKFVKGHCTSEGNIIADYLAKRSIL